MRPYLEDFRKRAAAAGVAGSGSLGQVAASFGVSQTRVSRLAGVLLAGLNRVLDQRGRLPARDGAQLAARLAARPAKVFACDGGGVRYPAQRRPGRVKGSGQR